MSDWVIRKIKQLEPYLIWFILLEGVLALVYLCLVFNTWFLGHTDALITNIVGLVTPGWTFSAIVIVILIITAFRKSIINKLDNMTSYEGKYGRSEFLVSQQNTPSTSSGLPERSQPSGGENTLADQRFFVEYEGIYQLVEDNIRADLNQNYDSLDDASKIELLLQAYAFGRVITIFENIYRTLFGSQIRLLKHINIAENKQISKFDAETWYALAKTQHVFYREENWDLAAYMGYMVHNGLISYDTESESYRITVQAIQFLDHLDKVSLSEHGKIY